MKSSEKIISIKECIENTNIKDEEDCLISLVAITTLINTKIKIKKELAGGKE